MLVASLTRIHSEMGHTSRVVAINPCEENFKPVIKRQGEDGVDWIAPKKTLGRLSRSLFIKKHADKFSPDVTFAHSVIPSAYARIACARNVISVLHSETNYEAGYVRFAEKLLQYKLAGVISVSEDARLNYSKNYSKPPSRHIFNGISLSDLKNNSAHGKSIRESLGIKAADYVVVQIGRVDPVKQQHLSLAAMIPVIKNNRAVHLLLAGLIEDDSYQTSLKQTARYAGVESNVHFLGPRNDVPDLLSAADLFLMPSRRESQGIAMIEALASGLPIIASPIGGLQWAERFEGVTLLPAENLERFTSAIRATLKQRLRYDRDLHGFDIRDTAMAYITFAEECTS